MARTCTVCASPERSSIDFELGRGDPERAVATRHKFPPSNIRRHKQNHLTPALIKVAAEKRTQEVAEATYVSVLERLEHLSDRIDRFISQAERKGAIVGGAAVLREMRQTLETIAKITGELDDSPKNQTFALNVLSTPEVADTVTRILELLGPFPDARIAVAGVLDIE